MATNAVPFALPLPPAGLVVEASLFIDFDGTLVELVERPDAVCIDGELRSLLGALGRALPRSEEHTSELQSLMRISYAVFCLKKKKTVTTHEKLQTQADT